MPLASAYVCAVHATRMGEGTNKGRTPPKITAEEATPEESGFEEQNGKKEKQ